MEKQSELKTDVLIPLLEKAMVALTPLTTRKNFEKVYRRLVGIEFIAKNAPKKSENSVHGHDLNQMLDDALTLLYKAQKSYKKPFDQYAFSTVEATLCEAWERCLAEPLNYDPVLCPTCHKPVDANYESGLCVTCEIDTWLVPAPALPAFDPFLIDADNRNKGESHRATDIARQALHDGLWDGKTRLYICGDVSVFHHKYLGLAKQKPTTFKLLHHNGIAFTYAHHDPSDIPNRLQEDTAFQAWAIENEESAIFGDGQS